MSASNPHRDELPRVCWDSIASIMHFFCVWVNSPELAWFRAAWIHLDVAEGLRHLSGLANLQHLDLVRTAITGPSLVHLIGLASLRELSVSGFQHHNQWLEMLRRDLPQCSIYLN